MTASASDNVGWIQLPDPPSSIPGGVLAQLNSNELLLAGSMDLEEDQGTNIIHGLYIFSTKTKQWRLWIKYPADFGQHIWRQQLMIDTKQNVLYLLYNSSPFRTSGKIAKIDVKTKQYQMIPALGTNAVDAVNIKDEIHIIGGRAVNRHIIFNKNTEKFQEIHEFEYERMLLGTSMVYIETKDVILTFGGITEHDQPSVGIMEYSLKTKKWRKIENIEYNYYGGHALLTKNEKHVILTPEYYNGDDESGTVNGVTLILDILDDEGYKLRKSAVSLSKLVDDYWLDMNMTLMGSDERENGLLVFGFVRNFGMQTDGMMVSNDVINLIVKFYEYEMLHVVRRNFDNDANDHWVIDISCIVAM